MAGSTFGSAFGHLRGLFAGGSVVALEDGQLLARYELNGDEAAFEALIGRHGPMVLSTCRAVLRDEHDVEDAFQATFVVLAKQARSIRGSEALGGWLHRVAYRASLRAGADASRRRRKEAEAARNRMDALMPGPSTELAGLLHEELERLPEAERLPVVLCDLEGLTYEQAAGELRWTVPTLRHRLVKARKRLKDRLTRRGVLTSTLAPSAVSPLLAGQTLSAVLGKSSKIAGSLLARTLIREILMTRVRMASAAALVVLGLASAGMVAAGGIRSEEAPEVAAPPLPLLTAAPEPADEKPVGLIKVRGIVVDPIGKPVAGAKIVASRPERMPEATSGPDGRFLLLVPQRDPYIRETEFAAYPRLAAWAPGFGLGWAKDAFKPGPSGEVTIKLTEDGPPIEGRIVDPEGRPVAGARVELSGVFVEDGTISFQDWLARAKTQETANPAKTLFGVSTVLAVETDADGRFRMAGIGRDRSAHLVVTGPTIAKTRLRVLVYDGPEVRIPPRPNSVTPPEILHARRFEAAVGPTRSIEGVVRDKDTGRGVEGMRVTAAIEDGRPLAINASVGFSLDIDSRTDAEGRYRLLGMPSAAAYRLLVDHFNGQVQPYASSIRRAPPEMPASGPFRLDVTLKRAVVVRGRVTDRATGRPINGRVEPLVFEDNPALAIDPNYAADRNSPRTNPDGRFELVTLPGRGLLAFRADRDEYVQALGAESIAGIDPRGVFPTRGGGCLAIGYHTLVGIDLDPAAESVTVDLQVDSGRSVDVEMVDVDGRPVEHLQVQQRPAVLGGLPTPQVSAIVKVIAVDPARPRRVSVFQEDRKLVGSIWMKGDEVGPLTVRMVPWGTVVARLIDSEGNPLSGRPVNNFLLNISPKVTEAEGPWRQFPRNTLPTTDKDGRFRVDGLVPGLSYSGTVGPFRFDPGFMNVVVGPGEVRDLGDLRSPLPRPKKE